MGRLLLFGTAWIAPAIAQQQELVLPPDPDHGMATLNYMLRLTERVRAAAPWCADVEDALRRARERQRPILTLVVADEDRVASPYEVALAEALWLEPEVADFVLERFVPLRVSIRAVFQVRRAAPPDDPLRRVGTTTLEARAPALIVSTPDGECLGRLVGIGTWSRELLMGFLLRTIEATGAAPEDADRTARFRADCLAGRYARALEGTPELDSPADRLRYGVALLSSGDARAAHDWFSQKADLPRELQDAASYWDALALAHLGRADEARAAWIELRRRTADAAPWGVRAELRSYWHDLIEGLAAAVPGEVPRGRTSTEDPRKPSDEPAVLRAAIAFLLRAQRSDGSFPHATYARYDAAVTALVAGALDRCRDQLDEETDHAIARAVDSAIAALDDWIGIAAARPEVADSWSAAYAVEFLAGMVDRSARARSAVPAGVDLLFATQLRNGAWSYDFRFGEGWKGGFGGWPKTDKGRAHSINTAIALWALARAANGGFALDQDRVGRGLDRLADMREAATDFTYTWPEPKCFERPGQSLGRAAVCLQALTAFERAEPKDLDAAIGEYLARVGELHATCKLTAAWVGVGGTSSYFYLHSLFHAADAIEATGGAKAASRLAQLRDELLRVVEIDGTWLDYEHSGKVYGTAMAVAVLARARAAAARVR